MRMDLVANRVREMFRAFDGALSAGGNRPEEIEEIETAESKKRSLRQSPFI
jgi:hypothetical protein